MSRYTLFLLSICMVFLLACSSDEGISTDLINNPSTASGTENTENMPVITFTSEVHNFGKVVQGETVKHSFTFKNTGKSDLIISSAQGSCGCTVPTWPKKPIKPGEKASIDVEFDTNGKQGKQNKTVTLVANTLPNTTVIAVRGEVLLPGEE